jgi:hypothetical protein
MIHIILFLAHIDSRLTHFKYISDSNRGQIDWQFVSLMSSLIVFNVKTFNRDQIGIQILGRLVKKMRKIEKVWQWFEIKSAKNLMKCVIITT